MPDFLQNGLITTLHDLGVSSRDRLEKLLTETTKNSPLGLVLPVTADDMRAPPFARIIGQLADVGYIDQIVVAFGVAPGESDYREARRMIAPLGAKAALIWTDGERVQRLYHELIEAGLHLSVPGKGRSVWTAFGYLLADSRLKAFALHDCDIVNYDREMLARLCLPMAHPSLDFDFCKAYYSRVTDRMYGRVVRLLVAPVLKALSEMSPHSRFLQYMRSFRYPLSGEFAVTSNLARCNRIPSDWGLEVGTLAEVYRNTSLKRVCQVELCREYEHKHQDLSVDDCTRGLMKMATDILQTLLRTLASMGVPFPPGNIVTLHSAYLRSAQDMIRQYHADALLNGLQFDRHLEEQTVEAFAGQIVNTGKNFHDDPTGDASIPNWSRVLAVFPDFPQRLRDAVCDDAAEFA